MTRGGEPRTPPEDEDEACGPSAGPGPDARALDPTADPHPARRIIACSTGGLHVEVPTPAGPLTGMLNVPIPARWALARRAFADAAGAPTARAEEVAAQLERAARSAADVFLAERAVLQRVLDEAWRAARERAGPGGVIDHEAFLAERRRLRARLRAGDLDPVSYQRRLVPLRKRRKAMDACRRRAENALGSHLQARGQEVVAANLVGQLVRRHLRLPRGWPPDPCPGGLCGAGPS